MKCKNKIINILAIFFGGMLFIPLVGILVIALIHLLEFCGLPLDIVFGNTVISVVTNEVAFGPVLVICIYLLGALLTYRKLYLKRK